MGSPGDIAHSEHIVVLELLGDAFSDHPKVSQRSMIPQFFSVGHLVKLGDTDTVFICRHLLRHNVHRNLGKVHICSNTCRCGDAGGGKYILDEHLRHLMGIHFA